MPNDQIMQDEMSKAPYTLDNKFERAVLRHFIFSKQFWSLMGRYLEPERFSLPGAVLVARAASEIGKEGKTGDAAGTLVLQRLTTRFHRGEFTQEELLVCMDLVDELEVWEAPPSPETVVDELLPIVKEQRSRDALRLAMERVAKREPMVEVIEHLRTTERIGQAEEVLGVPIGGQAFEAVRELRTASRLSTGVFELDTELSGGCPRKTLSVVMGGSGDGKCHAAGQGILMADGTIKKVEDIEIDDRLAAPDGGFRTVQSTITHYGLMYRIVPKNGSPWRVNGDHVLTLQGIGRYKGQIVDVSVKEWLGWADRRKDGFKLFRSPVAHFSCEASILPIDPYFLGVLLGDGSFHHTDVRVTTPDPEVAAEVSAQCVKHDLRLKVYKPEETAPSYALSGRRGVKNPVMGSLEQLKLRGCTAGDKFIPHIYKVASRRDRLALLAGLMDTDGSANKTAYDYISKSKVLADDVAFIARSLGFAAYVAECEKSSQNGTVGTYYRVGISGAVTEIPVRVPRKVLPERRQVKSVLRTGLDVEPTGLYERYYGFTLDGDGRYLLDDFTVTHNSMFLCHVAGSALLNLQNVAIATLELSEGLWYSRLLANLTGIPIDAIVDGSQEDECIARLSGMTIGNCVVAQFTAGVTMVQDIVNWLDLIEETFGWKPSVAVVDYADLLGFSKQRAYEGMQEVYGGLREDIAVKRDCWSWTASQARRQNDSKKKTQTKDDVADSAHKVRMSDLWINLLLSDDGSELEYLVAKNRTGKRGALVTLPTQLECARIAPIVDKSTLGVPVDVSDLFS